MSGRSTFQALIGTAKTDQPLCDVARNFRFQALIGTAKTDILRVHILHRVEFQALIGTAKTSRASAALLGVWGFKPS